MCLTALLLLHFAVSHVLCAAEHRGFTDQGVKSGPRGAAEKTPALNKPGSGFRDLGVQSNFRAVLRSDYVNKASKYAQKLFQCEKRLESSVKALPDGPVSLSDENYRNSLRDFIREIEEYQTVLRSFISSPTRRGLKTEFRSIERSFNLIIEGREKAVKASAYYTEDDVRKEPYFKSLYGQLMKDARHQIHQAVQYSLRGQGLQFIVKPVGFKEVVDASSERLMSKTTEKISHLVVQSIKTGRLAPPNELAKEMGGVATGGYRELVRSLKNMPRNTIGHLLAVALENANAKLIGTPLGELGRQYHRIERARSGAPMKELIRTTFKARLRKLLFGKSSNIRLKLLSKRLIVEAGQGVLINIALEILLPKLKEAFRPKGNLERRLKISTGTLKEAMGKLNSLGIDKGAINVRLSVVRDSCFDAIGTLNASRFLEKDVYRALGHKAQFAKKYRENLEALPLSRWAPHTAFKLGRPNGKPWVMKAYDENIEIIKQNQDDKLFMATIDFIVAHKLLEHTIERTRLRFMLDREEEFQFASEIFGTLPDIIRQLKKLEGDSALSGEKRVFFIIPPGGSPDGTFLYTGPYGKVPLLPYLMYIDPTQETSLEEGRIRAGALNVFRSVSAKAYLNKHLVKTTVGKESRFVFVEPRMLYKIGTSKFRLKNGNYTVAVIFYCETGEKLFFEYPLVVNRGESRGADRIRRARINAYKDLSRFNEEAKKFEAGQTTRKQALGWAKKAHESWLKYSKNLSLYCQDRKELEAAAKNVLFFYPYAREYVSTYGYEKRPGMKQDRLYRLSHDTFSCLTEIVDDQSYAQASAFFNKNMKYFYMRKSPNSNEVVFDVRSYVKLAELAVSLGKIEEGRALLLRAKRFVPGGRKSLPRELRILPEDYRN